jgi:hypothetical protein
LIVKHCLCCSATLGPRNRSGLCRSCVAKRNNADPAIIARRAAAISARFADPAVREAASQRMRKVIAGLAPSEIERRREHGRRQVRNFLSRPEVVAKTLAPEVRARAGRSRSATVLAWCPPEWRDTYRGLTRKGRPARVAKAMVLDMIAGGTVVLYAEQKAKLAWCPDNRRKQYNRLRNRHGAAEARRLVGAEMQAARLAGYDVEAAVDHLRRFGPVVRCTPAGGFDPKGRHWRRGSAVLTAAEIVERALAKGWTPDAWRRVA